MNQKTVIASILSIMLSVNTANAMKLIESPSQNQNQQSFRTRNHVLAIASKGALDKADLEDWNKAKAKALELLEPFKSGARLNRGNAVKIVKTLGSDFALKCEEVILTNLCIRDGAKYYFIPFDCCNELGIQVIDGEMHKL